MSSDAAWQTGHAMSPYSITVTGAEASPRTFPFWGTPASSSSFAATPVMLGDRLGVAAGEAHGHEDAHHDDRGDDRPHDVPLVHATPSSDPPGSDGPASARSAR